LDAILGERNIATQDVRRVQISTNNGKRSERTEFGREKSVAKTGTNGNS